MFFFSVFTDKYCACKDNYRNLALYYQICLSGNALTGACELVYSLCCVFVQVGESFGPVRALAEGKPGELFVGTTKNAIIRAAFPDTLTPIVQVRTHKHTVCMFILA